MNSDKQLLYDLFQAYYDARRNKRRTINALAFEIDYETKLFQLYEEIKNRKYEINPSICFMIKEPMIREVFAADFRDRIVHHLIYNYISSYFERLFINDSYSCRIGKGTSYGIKRVDHFIRSCSRNYTQDCYILKLDIKGYFMAMDRSVLYQQVKKILDRFQKKADPAPDPSKQNKFAMGQKTRCGVNFDFNLIMYIIRKIIFYDPTKNCVIRGMKNDWQELPNSKSLFRTEKNKGLPIGNLTSQLFGNVYLNDFDHFVKHKLGCKYYGRYVDDFVIIHQDKEYLKSIIPVLRKYLQDELFLELHPKKIYLQHFSKGAPFLGVAIKPHRIYIRNRIKGNFYKKIEYWNNFLEKKNYRLASQDVKQFLSSINSYLGIMKHYNTYKIREKMLTQNLSARFESYFYFSNDYTKISSKI